MSKSNTGIMAINSDAKGVLQPANLEQAIELAKYVANSGMVPKQYIGNPGAVLIATQMGAELGLSMLASLQNIAVINGRPCVWGDAMKAICLASPLCEGIEETFDEKTMTATCTVTRKGKKPAVSTFSAADAKTAGLWGKAGPWTQHPKRMIQMRARGFGLRDNFADLLLGLQVREEVEDIGVIETAPPSPGRASFRDKPKIEDEPKPKQERVAQDAECTEDNVKEPAEPKPGSVLAANVTEPIESEALQAVLAGIANADAWGELNAMAREVNKLSPDDKEAARVAFKQRKEEIETTPSEEAREPGSDG